MACGLAGLLDDGAGVLCPKITINNDWNAAGGFFCGDGFTAAVLQETYPQCFNNNFAHIVTVTTNSVTGGSLIVKFQGVTVATISANGSTDIYIYGTAIVNAVLTFETVDFDGCFNYSILVLAPSWTSLGWTPTANGFCHRAGASNPLVNMDEAIIAGNQYTITATVTGRMTLHVGGVTINIPSAGTYTFNVVALVDNEYYFEAVDINDTFCVTFADLCDRIFAPACTTYSDCDNKNLSWEQLVKLLVASSTDNCPALRVLVSEAGAVPSGGSLELRNDGGRELRNDGTFELRN